MTKFESKQVKCLTDSSQVTIGQPLEEKRKIQKLFKSSYGYNKNEVLYER